VFVCAGSYRHRPSHMDMLHVDVRMSGSEVVVDPGTFAYNAAPPWNNPLASATFHNGPVLDHSEPAERGRRFFWRTWPNARLTETSYQPGRALIITSVPGRVERRVLIDAFGVAVTDTVLDTAVTNVEVNWLVNTHARAAIEAEGSEVVDATEGDPVAWFSPTYGYKQPMQVVRVRRTRLQDTLQIATLVRSA